MSASPRKPFLDTTILIYSVSDDPRAARAETLLARGGTISVQVLNEFVSVGRRKLGMNWEEIGAALVSIRTLCAPPVAIDVEMHEQALKIAARPGYHIYDALVIAAAIGAGCNLLYSEDMQNGQRFGSLVIRNPFLTADHA